MAVECGQHQDEQSIARALDVSRRFLHGIGLVVDASLTSADASPTLLSMECPLKRLSADFEFTRPYRGLERLEAGDVFARSGGVEMRMLAPRYVVLPNPDVQVGEDMAYFAIAD